MAKDVKQQRLSDIEKNLVSGGGVQLLMEFLEERRLTGFIPEMKPVGISMGPEPTGLRACECNTNCHCDCKCTWNQCKP